MKNAMKKTVLITGATSGIGEACARRFARGGYQLVLTGRNEEKLDALRKELEGAGAVVKTLVFDVRNREAATTAVDSLWEGSFAEGGFEGIDVLINNAGLALRGCGHIINIGSVAGDAAYANGNVYCATKAAVKALSDGLRIDLAETPLRVTNVKPGLVETNFSVTRFHGDKQRADNVYNGIKPLTGDDIADVCFYAAEAPAHVQIAEVLVLATHQANGTVIHRETK